MRDLQNSAKPLAYARGSEGPRDSKALTEPRPLARPSQFEGLTGAKPFRISEGYPRVFTTEKGAATYLGVIWEALIRSGGWDGSVIRIWFSSACTSGSGWV